MTHVTRRITQAGGRCGQDAWVEAADLVAGGVVAVGARGAEADFTAAQGGITDQTPPKQASQQFNAAAVALEMAWLGLFADAGCLTDEQGH
jgi:hypothetical protein